MTPAKFARELAAAVAAGLPEGFTCTADGDTITVETPSGEGVTTALDLDADDEGDTEVYADAAEGVLSLAQDVVCDALDASWPGSGAGDDLPIPGASVDGATVRLWYGDEDAPVLALTPVALDV